MPNLSVILDQMQLGSQTWLQRDDLGLTAEEFHAAVVSWLHGHERRLQVIDLEREMESDAGLYEAAKIERR